VTDYRGAPTLRDRGISKQVDEDRRIIHQRRLAGRNFFAAAQVLQTSPISSYTPWPGAANV
jgi:hypothetical protein